MRKTILLAIAAVCAIAIARSANAQQSPEDGRIAVYRQLLAASNDNVAALGAQLQAAQIDNAQLKAERDKLKADAEKKP